MSDSHELIEIDVDSDNSIIDKFPAGSLKKTNIESDEFSEEIDVEISDDEKHTKCPIITNSIKENGNNTKEGKSSGDDASPVVSSKKPSHEDLDEFIVEVLMDKVVDEDDNASYNVKWENYGIKENTWEPVENLVACDWTLQNFQLSRAQWLAARYNNMFNNDNESGPSNGNHPRRAKNSNKTNNGVTTRIMREWKVEDIVGLTEIKNEKYFLLRLENCHKKAFIRATLANRLFPNRVIDFYMKHLKWKHKKIKVLPSTKEPTLS